MRIFAISDLHLASNPPKNISKAMDRFGAHWSNHWDKIREDWFSRVTNDDVVLISGDLSWAMKYEEAAEDLSSICEMPGHKILIKGNHDYWHVSLGKTRSLLSNNTYLIQNDAVKIEDTVFVGSRGWRSPTDFGFDAQDQKLYDREIGRLKLSIDCALRLKGTRIVGMMHYPPYLASKEPSLITDIFSSIGADTVVYGHIHGDAFKFYDFSDSYIRGVRYCLTSCDYLNFKLKEL